MPSAVEEYAEYNHAASTGQHLLRWSSMSPPLLAPPHALLIPSKSSSERVRGQPATSDSSGNAGIVVEGLDGVSKTGLRVVVAAESGWHR